MSVLGHGSEPPDLYTDTAGEAWFCLAATAGPGVLGSRCRSYTCTHVTAAPHVLYIDARARQPYYRHYALAPKVSAADLVSSYQGRQHGERRRYTQYNGSSRVR